MEFDTKIMEFEFTIRQNWQFYEFPTILSSHFSQFVIQFVKNKMTSISESSDILSQELEAYRNSIVNDEPKIETSLKNLVSIILGRVMSPSTERERELEDRLGPAVVLSCARILLKTINAAQLIDTVVWGTKNPQGIAQLSLQRIEQLTRYNVIVDMHNRAVSKGGKTGKLFGKSFFTWCNNWDVIRAAAEDENLSTECYRRVPVDVLAYFLDFYGFSFGCKRFFSKLFYLL